MKMILVFPRGYTEWLNSDIQDALVTLAEDDLGAELSLVDLGKKPVRSSASEESLWQRLRRKASGS
eukprot:m.203709 g.203709  ORF g.203709 m.203709 type:complete len:66 (+) comp39629_c0_seq18:73-270(+)